MSKFKLSFIISIVAITAVIIAINIVIRQAEKESIPSISRGANKKYDTIMKAEDTDSGIKKQEEAPPKVVPQGEVFDN